MTLYGPILIAGAPATFLSNILRHKYTFHCCMHKELYILPYMSAHIICNIWQVVLAVIIKPLKILDVMCLLAGLS